LPRLVLVVRSLGEILQESVSLTNADEPEEVTQEQRAMRSLEAIFGGADLSVEATELANEFTHRHSGRFTAWIRRFSRGNRPAQ